MVVELYGMRADRLLADNLRALIHERRAKQYELARWCGHSEVWISQILRNERTVTVKDLDRIADFFGLQPYHLFQPGIHGVAERRSGTDRRSGKERRKNAPVRTALDVGADVQLAHPRGRPLTEAELALLKHFRRSTPQVQELTLLAAGAPPSQKRKRATPSATLTRKKRDNASDTSESRIGARLALDASQGGPSDTTAARRSVSASDVGGSPTEDRPNESPLRDSRRVRRSR